MRNDIVRSFLNSDVFKNPQDFDTYIHPDFRIQWLASTGPRNMDAGEFQTFLLEMGKDYEEIRIEITKFVSDGDQVSVAYTIWSITHENPTEEVAMGHFVSFYTIMDEKIISCYQMSQQAVE